MKPLRSLVVLLILLPAITIGCTSGQECVDSIPEEVKELVRFRVDHGNNVGIVIGVVTPCGAEYYSYGSMTDSADLAVDENTIFEIGSVTKVFTSILLVDMVEGDEVSLNDPIERYLPSDVSAPTYNGQSITLVDLATHTSGLPRLPANLSPADPDNPYADYSVEQMYDFLSNYTLWRDIGEEYEYSNLGMGLLGHLLALHNGTTYEDLVVELITDELGMADTRISLTPEMQARLATGHDEDGPVSNWDIPTLAGAGALRSTTRDMITFLAANMGLQQSHLHSAMQTTHQSRIDAGDPALHIGLGWHIRTIGEREIIWHNGGTGGYRSIVGFVQDEERGVVILTNTTQELDEIGLHLLDPSIPLR